MIFRIFLYNIIIPKRLRRCWDFLKTTLLKFVIMPLHSSLRSIFSKSTLKASLKFALTAAVGVATITSLTSFAPISTSMDEVIASAPDTAVGFQQVKDNLRDNYKMDFNSTFAEFKESCPSVTKEQAASLLNGISTDEYLNAPVQFRERAYMLATQLDEVSPNNKQKNSDDRQTSHTSTLKQDPKLLALMNIGKTLPDSVMLTNYLQRKRIEIAETLHRDPEIIKATIEWNSTSDVNYKTKILQHVSRITLNALLPDKVINYPKVVWIMEKKPNPVETTNKAVSPYALTDYDLAFYRASINEIHINGRLNPVRFQFQTAVDLVTHESVHAFQDILISWGMNGYLTKSPEVNRHVAFMYANRRNDAGAIRSTKYNEKTKTEMIDPVSYNGYRLMKTESMAWGFARIGQTLFKASSTKDVLSDISHDMYHDYSTTNPQSSVRNNKLVAVIPTASDNILSGTIPTICH